MLILSSLRSKTILIHPIARCPRRVIGFEYICRVTATNCRLCNASYRLITVKFWQLFKPQKRNSPEWRPDGFEFHGIVSTTEIYFLFRWQISNFKWRDCELEIF